MNCLWNHIVISCLLTVLGIYGTEGTLWIPYTLNGGEPGVVELEKCSGVVNLSVDLSADQPITFKVMGTQTSTYPTLFAVWRGHHQFCSVHYQQKGLSVVSNQDDKLIAVETEADNNEVGEIVLSMDEVYDEENRVADFAFGKILYLASLPLRFSLIYKHGLFLSWGGRFPNLFNRRWNFSPTSSARECEFTCNQLGVASLEDCIGLPRPRSGTTSTKVAYVVESQINNFRIVRGNTKKAPNGTVCKIGVEYTRYEVQFPFFGRKKYINVAFKRDGDTTTNNGIRVYTGRTKLHS